MRILFILMGIALLLSACLLEAKEHTKVINVSTVDQLYSAVNNAANAGATIYLSPGTYLLSETNSEGETRPNHGSLRLRPGMSLVGSERRVDPDLDGVPDPLSYESPDTFALPGTETKIDGSGLILPVKLRKDCGTGSAVFPEPVIAISSNNSVSFLELDGGDNVTIGEPANPVDSVKSLSIKMTNTVLDSSFIAMTFSNSGCDRSHARSVLIFTNNVVRNAGFFGLAMFNFVTGNDANDTQNGPEIHATVSYNLFYNNDGPALSLRGGAIGTDGGVTRVEMTRNIFRNNGSNILGIGGGGGRPTTTPAVGSHLYITSRFDSFGVTSVPSTNIYLVGGRAVGSPDEPKYCTLRAEFFHPSFYRTGPPDRKTPEIFIIGGEDGGNGNHAKVLIRYATVTNYLDAPGFGSISIQDETIVGDVANTARLIGSRDAFRQLNQGFHTPPSKFFLEK